MCFFVALLPILKFWLPFSQCSSRKRIDTIYLRREVTYEFEPFLWSCRCTKWSKLNFFLCLCFHLTRANNNGDSGNKANENCFLYIYCRSLFLLLVPLLLLLLLFYAKMVWRGTNVKATNSSKIRDCGGVGNWLISNGEVYCLVDICGDALKFTWVIGLNTLERFEALSVVQWNNQWKFVKRKFLLHLAKSFSFLRFLFNCYIRQHWHLPGELDALFSFSVFWVCFSDMLIVSGSQNRKFTSNFRRI